MFINDVAPTMVLMIIKTSAMIRESEKSTTCNDPIGESILANIIDATMNRVKKIVDITASLFLPLM